MQIRSLGSLERDIGLALLLGVSASVAAWGVVNYVAFEPLLNKPRSYFLIAIFASAALPAFIYYNLVMRNKPASMAVVSALTALFCCYLLIHFYAENGRYDGGDSICYQAVVLKKLNGRYPTIGLSLDYQAHHIEIEQSVNWQLFQELAVSDFVLVKVRSGYNEIAWLESVQRLGTC